jgi:D-3-phosphoglycerate dehydrogenase
VLRLTGLDDFDLEIEADRILLFFRYVDRPGVVGAVGTLLGEAGVNIAAMQVSRRDVGGEALMTLTVDTPLAPELLDRAASAIGAAAASAVDLTD